jgi:SAM-dependent methyltransferase
LGPGAALALTPGVARYAVCIVSPPGYPHSAAFREVGETLVHGLSALGHDAVLGDDPAPAGRRAIVLGANLLPVTRQPVARDAILYNLEQIEPGSAWLGPDYVALLQDHEVWDYSARNAARYAALGLPAPRVVPIGWAPVLERIPRGEPEDVDVLFYGSMNERRRAVLEGLAARGLRVEAAFGLYGAARDARIARARIVLNVHFYEAKVFEIVRVSYLLANRRCVVSERGGDPAEERDFEAGVAFAPYEDLVETCVRLARDPAARERLAAAGQALMAARPEAECLRPVVGAVSAPAARPASPPATPMGDPRGAPPTRCPVIQPAPPLSPEDVAALAPPEGKRLLLVGCGDGELGAALAAGGASEVVGLDACARGLARCRLTAVYRQDADAAPTLPYPDGYFDAIVVEDLSRLAAPAATLAHVARWLAPDGRVVCVVPNGRHEAALAALLGHGGWPAGAGARPYTLAAALEALRAAGLEVQDDAVAVRTEPGELAPELGALAVRLGAEPAAIADELTLARVILLARRARRPAAPAAEPIPDPWRGSRPVRVLLAPDLSRPGDGWLDALGAAARGLAGDAAVTVGVALPLAALRAPPPALLAAVGGADVDLLLTEAPADPDGWARLLGGASVWIATGDRADLEPVAARVGVDVRRAEA